MPPPRLQIRPARSDQDLEAFASVVTTVLPEDPTSVAEMRWADSAYPGSRRFLAWLDGEPVGAAGVGRVYMYGPEFEGLWGNLAVLERHRRRGAGSALLEAISDAARDAGKTLLLGRTTADHQDAIEFLEHRGFEEFERMKVVRLDLSEQERPEVEPPAGIEITSLEERPDLGPGIYEVANEAIPDIPSRAPSAQLSYEEFRVLDVDRPTIPHGAFAVAIESATGRVVGYANLLLVPGSPGVAWHGMTGVLREFRGRGLASALKRATIRWAKANGLRALETANDLDNAPMRAVNRRLGYEPRADDIEFRGPPWPPRAAVGAT